MYIYVPYCMYTNLPSLVLEASHLNGSAFCNFRSLGVPELVVGGIPLWKINLLNFHVVKQVVT